MEDHFKGMREYPRNNAIIKDIILSTQEPQAQAQYSGNPWVYLISPVDLQQGSPYRPYEHNSTSFSLSSILF